jgi:hypothetical protein
MKLTTVTIKADNEFFNYPQSALPKRQSNVYTGAVPDK